MNFILIFMLIFTLNRRRMEMKHLWHHHVLLDLHVKFNGIIGLIIEKMLIFLSEN